MVTLTVTWKAPGDASLPGCLVDPDKAIHCLKADGTFLIKEGKQTNFNESFTVSEDASLIGVSIDNEVNRDKRAGGFETTGFKPTDCETGSSSLATHQDLSSTNNGLDLLLPADVPDGQDRPGSSRVDRGGGADGRAWSPVPRAVDDLRRGVRRELRSAGDVPRTRLRHERSPITVRIRVLESALLPGDSITQMFHNGKALPWCTDTSTKPPTDNSTNANGCVVSINRSSGPNKIMTLIGKAKTNGPWGG